MVNTKERKRSYPWFKDFTVRHVNEDGSGGTGPPPTNHPRRCQSPNNEGTQCGRWALRGYDYCQFHGAKHGESRKRMGEYYSKHCGPKLKTLLEEAAKESDEERLSLAKEVDATRTLTARAVKIYSDVVVEDSLKDKGKTAAQIANAKAMATALVFESLDAVQKIVGQMAKVDALRKDKLPIDNIDWFVHRMMIILQEELKTCPEEEKKIQKRIEQMQAPGRSHNIVLSV